MSGRLLAWVPNGLISLADRGIEANPEQRIQWAERSELNSLEV
jgi:hypothetical protein